MLPSVASTSLAVCLPRLGGTASGVFVGVSNVAIRSAIGVARCARGHTSIRFAAASGVASVAKDKFRKLNDRLAFVFVFRLARFSIARGCADPGRGGRLGDSWIA